MNKVLRVLVHLVIAIGCLAAGLWAGSLVQGDASAAEFSAADISELHRETGTQVVMFSTSTCSHCRDARDFLSREHVQYKDFNIDQSPDAQARFRSLRGGGVPLLFIGDRAVLGFREAPIRQALAALKAGSTSDSCPASASCSSHANRASTAVTSSR